MRKGQLLIEVMIAVSVAVVAIVGIVQVANRSVNNSGAARRQSEATTYGTEAIEWIVAQKDIGGWGSLVSHANNTYCFNVSPPDSNWPGTGSCSSGQLIGSPAQYLRQVVLTLIGPDNKEVRIDATVSWNEGGRTVSSRQSRTVGRY